MNVKRTVSLLLSVLLLLPAWAACSEKPAEDAPETHAAEETAGASAEPAAAEEPQKDMLDAREDVSDDLPEADFD